jgi:type II secretory pathway component PulK
MSRPSTTSRARPARPQPDARRRRRGTILIITMLVIFTLASIVLVFSRRMSVEAIASANQVAYIQAGTIEKGAEQYVMQLLNVNSSLAMDLTQDYFEAVPCGDGFFWIVRPQYYEDDLPLFGLVDECSKVGINYAGYESLIYLPGMTDSIASSIIDWRDTDDNVYNTGAESQYYLTLPQPYYCKNQPFDTVEELLMVAGMTRAALYGDSSAPPLGTYNVGAPTGDGVMLADPVLLRGWYDLFTVNAYSPATQQTNNQPARGLININTAPRAVLLTLQPFGLEAGDIDSIISQRLMNASLGNTDTAWLGDAIGQQKAGNLADYICGQSYRYSADIVAVSRDGRGFRRVRIVIDASTNPATIVYRRDMTEQGFPLDPAILTDLRNGQNPVAGAGGMGYSTGGTLR